MKGDAGKQEEREEIRRSNDGPASKVVGKSRERAWWGGGCDQILRRSEKRLVRG